MYIAGTTATNGYEIYVSDGTDAGTSVLKDFVAGTGSSSSLGMTIFNHKLFIIVNSNEVWRSDGTTVGTTKVYSQPSTNSGYAYIYSSYFESTANYLFIGVNDLRNDDEYLVSTNAAGDGFYYLGEIMEQLYEDFYFGDLFELNGQVIFTAPRYDYMINDAREWLMQMQLPTNLSTDVNIKTFMPTSHLKVNPLTGYKPVASGVTFSTP